MPDEMNTNQQEQGMEQDYLAQIQELKKNSVSREDYDKMRDENKKLLEALVSGKQFDEEVETKHQKTVDELREQLFNGQNNNLTYVSAALELRDALLDQGAEDPFVPTGRKISPTREDYELAAKVAEGLKHCVEFADGDSAVFTNELQRITKDTVIPTKGRNRR